MRKEIRVVDEKKGIILITTPDERWYVKEILDEETGIPKLKFVPSVTWITDYYPKGVGFYKWLANKGWDEAESIKEASADKGTKVHLAVGSLISGEVVRICSKFPNKDGVEEELTTQEYECLMSFVRWANECKPEFLDSEFVVFSDKDEFAGTVDLTCVIDGKKYIVDVKTSQNVWPSHRLQVSAYKHALPDTEEYGLAILQLGYNRNKNRFKFTEVEDRFDLFLSAKQIWQEETKTVKPKQSQYPLEIKL